MKWNKIKRNYKKWIRYFHLFKPMIEGRFLYEFLVPNDILDLAKNVKLKEVSDPKVYRFIIACSFFNAVLVGLPGSLGGGVFIAMGFEVLIAFQLARMSKLLDMKGGVSDLLKLIPATGVTLISVLYGFKVVLNSVYAFLNFLLPMVPISFLATFFTTLFYSLFLYITFCKLESGTKITISPLFLIR